MENIGEYVLATKYDDGDPCDHFCVGFVSGYTEHEQKRYLIVDNAGMNQRHNGFRRAEQITQDEGQQLVDKMSGFADFPGLSLWRRLARIRDEKETGGMSAINWRADSWFASHHADKLAEEFKAWWVKFYGLIEQYEGKPDEQDEYWVRCAFAWNGWEARGNLTN